MTLLQTLVTWFLEPGDPLENDRRVVVVLILALLVVWAAPVCILIMARGS